MGLARVPPVLWIHSPVTSGDYKGTEIERANRNNRRTLEEGQQTDAGNSRVTEMPLFAA